MLIDALITVLLMALLARIAADAIAPRPGADTRELSGLMDDSLSSQTGHDLNAQVVRP